MPGLEKLQKLQAMGLGPVWQRRDRPVAEAEPEPEPEPEHVSAQANVQADIASMDWDQLHLAITACRRCRLCEHRTQALPGSGDRHAAWLLLSAAPDRDEDQQGQALAGTAGSLLGNMLTAVELERDSQTFLTHLVKCRPLGADGHDRPAAADEIAACLPYLQRQIALIQPELLLALGQTAATALLAPQENPSLAELRGRVHRYGSLPVVVTHHPQDLLRSPLDKAASWRDLCVAKNGGDGH